MDTIKVKINGIEVCAPKGSTILEAARLAHIEIPTLCFLKEINEIGACRICVVEVKGARSLVASCVYPISEGMEIKTNSPKVLDSRRKTLQLLLSNHERKCLSCVRSGNCELQQLAKELGVEDEDYYNGEKTPSCIDDSAVHMIRDNSKCILCRRCTAVCEKVQGIGVIGANNRGFHTTIGSAFEMGLGETSCVSCGQCIAVCPTGALQEKSQVDEVLAAIADPSKHVIVQTAPAVRAALGEEFGYPIGTNVEGKMAAALRRIGFDGVFDTNFSADLTIMEEAHEFLDRVQNGGVLPLITSCSPGWIKYCEHYFPDMTENLSSCKSPQQMFGAIAKSYYAEKMGLKPVIYRAAVSVLTKRQHYKIGYCGAVANKQYEYDHKDDQAIFMDKKYLERKLEVMQTTYEHYKKEAAGFAGPACIDMFGEEPFEPVAKETVAKLSESQEEMILQYDSRQSQMVNRYIKGEERSFTIIAYPVPEIGEKYEEIFDEIIRINTLDAKVYEKVQQTLIDALDQGEYVHILGTNGNRTDLNVQLHPLNDPAKETIFENCVADVNIPVGEVFTSPVLEGTNGVLHVSKVYLNELQYRDLEITFSNGMVSEYNCANFDRDLENKAYIHDNVLYKHPTLPLGEFAIGTNTTAYVTARKYRIEDKMPILIAEKMGPHFAVGDTCYSWCEDIKVYNPNGKEIIARDNSVSIRRKEDVSKAYFHCHTDITIPYEELGSITVVTKDKKEIVLLENGKFVLPGTEILNEPLKNSNK